MKDYILKKFLLSNRLSLLNEKKRLYDETLDTAEIVNWQIHRFNMVWERCNKTIPFYKQWRMQHKLPGSISSLKELRNFPLLTKRVIQDNQDIIFQNGKIRRYISTGGSTGVPTRFPSSSKDALPVYADTYLGRSWWGIRPLDSMLLFWGHSHLFGAGLRGVLNHYKRKMYDYVSNIIRLNAYDVTAETIDKYMNIYRHSNPSFIIGYTSCIYKLAKYIYENNLDCGKKDRLKAIILTSETITQSDVELLKKVFRVPIVIEYGMAETGVVGYSRDYTWNIKIFWDSFVATAGSDRVINITTTYDRFFPLINYHTDDIVEVGKEVGGSILDVHSILGRRRETLRIGCVEGSCLELSGVLIVHILKSYPHIFSIQFEQLESNQIRIFLVANHRLDLQNVKDYFLKEIRKDHKKIDGNCIDIVQVDSISKTLAGKESMLCS